MNDLPPSNISDKNTISKTKVFQFETQFCHVTTNEILHMNSVLFGIRQITLLK